MYKFLSPLYVAFVIIFFPSNLTYQRSFRVAHYHQLKIQQNYHLWNLSNSVTLFFIFFDMYVILKVKL